MNLLSRVGPAPLICTLVVLTFHMGACGQNGRSGGATPSPTTTTPPKSVSLVPIQVHKLDRFVEITGTLYGQEEVSIAAEVGGRITEIHADLGESVAPGGPLAQIDPTDYQLAVDQEQAALAAALAKLGVEQLPVGEFDMGSLPLVARAEAEAANAAAKYERARKLFERTPPLLSEQDFADIRTSHEVAVKGAAVERLNARTLLSEARVAASSLRTAEQRLADAGVIAPPSPKLSYQVAARRISIGEVVTPGQVLFRLVAADRVKFRGMVPERYAQIVKQGARAVLVSDAFEQRFKASVARVSPAVDVATRSFEVEIEADNPAGRLKPGSFLRARILTGSTPDARFVPASAISQFAGVQRVYSVNGGKVAEHRVELGESDHGAMEIVSGLDGVTDVIDRPGNVREGQAVRPSTDEPNRQPAPVKPVLDGRERE